MVFSFCFFSSLCFGTMDHFNYMVEPNYGCKEPHFGYMSRFESLTILGKNAASELWAG